MKKMCHRIIMDLRTKVENDKDLEKELKHCILKAHWTPPGWVRPASSLDDFYDYLNQLMNSTPSEPTFDNLFHGLYYIISQGGNKLQKDEKFLGFREWLVLFVEQYGSVYKGCWPIDENSEITVSKGNKYSIEELLKGSDYGDMFSNGFLLS